MVNREGTKGDKRPGIRDNSIRVPREVPGKGRLALGDYPDNGHDRGFHEVGYLQFDDFGEGLGAGEQLDQDLETYSRRGSAFSSRYSSRSIQAQSGYYDDVRDQMDRSSLSQGRRRVDYDQQSHSSSRDQNLGQGRGYGRNGASSQGRITNQGYDQNRGYDPNRGYGQNRGFDQNRGYGQGISQGRTVQRSQGRPSQQGQRRSPQLDQGTRLYDAEEDRTYQRQDPSQSRATAPRRRQQDQAYDSGQGHRAQGRRVQRAPEEQIAPQRRQASTGRRTSTPRNARTAASYSRSNYTGPEAQERNRHTASLSGGGSRALTRRRDKAASYDRDPNGYARNASRNDEALRARKRKRRKRTFAAVGCLILLLALALGGVYAYARITMAKPFYTLVLGTDSDGGDYERTDSIMLVRVDPPNKTAALISLPRDTYVTMPGYEFHKLNSAFAYGDVELMVDTVEALVGVKIPYYVTLNYDGLCESVDKLGGIEVDVPVYVTAQSSEGDPLWDLHGNVLSDVEAGYQTLNGMQALTLCRSRAYKSADFMRTAMQRLVLEAIAKKVMNGSPKEIYAGITSVLDCINTNLNAMQLFVCAMFMRGMDTSQDIWTLLIPCEDVWIDDVAYVQVDEDAMRTVIREIESGIEPVAQIDEY